MGKFDFFRSGENT